MTAFSDAEADLLADPDIGSASWWLDQATSSHTPVQAVISRPARAELLGEAPMARNQRFIDLELVLAAVAGDLVAAAGRTWRLGGQPDPDQLGLTGRWTATELVGPTIVYHATGYPLLSWSGTQWVAV